MMTFLTHLINGISLGSVYAIIALGYTMVYGIAKMLNFAHGDVIMVGAYVCFFAVSSFHLPAIVGILVAMALCTMLGIVIERLAYKPLRQAASLAVLITAIGVSYFLQNGAQLLWDSTIFFASCLIYAVVLVVTDNRTVSWNLNYIELVDIPELTSLGRSCTGHT